MTLYCTIIDTDGKAEIETITNFLIAYNFATSRVSILFSQYSKKGAKINEVFFNDLQEGDDNFKAEKRGKHEKSEIAVERVSALQKLARQTS